MTGSEIRDAEELWMFRSRNVRRLKSFKKSVTHFRLPKGMRGLFFCVISGKMTVSFLFLSGKVWSEQK